MKCENCGKNEVTFVYQSNINGQIEEKHLCSECAEKLGYTRKLAAHSRAMMQNFFGGGLLGGAFDGGLTNGGFFDDFFSPMPSLLGRMDHVFGEGLFDDFFSDMPALGAAPAQQEEQQDALVSREEQSRFSHMRQLNALRMEMKKAVHQENFERAAELRDQIRALEAEHKERKESK